MKRDKMFIVKVYNRVKQNRLPYYLQYTSYEILSVDELKLCIGIFYEKLISRIRPNKDVNNEFQLKYELDTV